jgi:hypothetical protein
MARRLQSHPRLQAASAAAAKEHVMEQNTFNPLESRFVDRLVSALATPRGHDDDAPRASAAETAAAWARAFAEHDASSRRQ